MIVAHRRARLLPCLILATLMSADLPAATPATPATPANIEEMLAANVTTGRAEWLEAAGGRFLGLYTEATTPTPQGGIILLHGTAAHADWPGVIHPLRRDLPGYGWTTLSIQLPTPVLAKDGRWELAPVFDAGKARIDAAVALLEKQGLKNIVIVGHDVGAAVAAAALAGVKNGKIAGFVAVGMGLPLNSGETPYRPELLEQIAVPVLDIYGSRDSDAVTQEAARRAEAARKGGALVHRGQQLDPLRRSATARFPVSEQSGYITYRQMELAGADHFFTAYDHVLTKRIAGWLRKHATGVAVPRASSSDAAAPG